MRTVPTRTFSWTFASGGVFVFIGMVMLLDHMGVINASGLWRFWPMILILAGILKALNECSRMWGIILIAVGVVLELGEFHVVRVTWDMIWPMGIIAVGLILIWSTIQAKKAGLGGSGNAEFPTGPGALNEIAVFSGIEKRITGKNFSGGKMVAIFGGIEIDLWQAEMEGDEAVLQIDAIFGGVEIRVPDTWLVSSHGQGVFGGYNDSTRLRPATDPNQPRKTLVLRGAAIFGGVEIRN